MRISDWSSDVCSSDLSNPQSFPKPEKPSAKEEAPVALSRPLSSKPSAGKKKLARCATRRLGQIHPDHVMLSRCGDRSEEHTSELQSLMRISYAVFCLKKQNKHNKKINILILNQ